MSNPKSLLEKVLRRLKLHKGSQLIDITSATGISYDTLLRIRDGKVDPAFSRVQKLAEYFGIVRGL